MNKVGCTEICKMLNVKKNSFYNHTSKKAFPKPISRRKVKNSRASENIYNEAEVLEYIENLKPKLDIELIKRLTASNLNRAEIAEKLNVTVKALNSFCLRNKIISQASKLDKRTSRRVADPLHEIFKAYLSNHVRCLG